MKKLLVLAFVAAQVSPVAAPAAAAELIADTRPESARTGAFAGARLRIALDPAPRERVRAGLTLAPTLRSVRQDGSSRLRIGEGLEYGIRNSSAPELSLAGRPVRALLDQSGTTDGRRNNISPAVAYVAVAVGIAGVAYLIWFTSEMNEPHD